MDEKIKIFLAVQKTIQDICTKIINGRYPDRNISVNVQKIEKAYRLNEFKVDVNYWHFGEMSTKLSIPFDALISKENKKQYIKEQINMYEFK